MKRTVIQIISALAIGTGLIVLTQACTESQGKGSTIPKLSEPIPVRILTLTKSVSGNEIVTSGKLTTNDETVLAFKTPGVVNAVFVDEGDKVSAGQLLATLDLTEINSTVAQAKSGVEKAERDFLRVKNLYRDSVATLEQLQNSETALEMARQQFKTANFNRSYSEIRARANGYVLNRFVNPGQVIGVGDPVLQTNGAGSGRWILKSGVSDKQWSAVKVGDVAKVKVDAFPGKIFNGTVTRRSETADPLTGSFTVEITVDGREKFASGMFASATIVSSERLQAWTVPYEAVLYANGNEGFVFVTDDGKTASKRPVIFESFNGHSIQITKGLENAKSLIVAGSAYVTDQSPIRVIQ